MTDSKRPKVELIRVPAGKETEKKGNGFREMMESVGVSNQVETTKHERCEEN